MARQLGNLKLTKSGLKSDGGGEAPLLRQLFEAAQSRNQPPLATMVELLAEGMKPNDLDVLSIDVLFATRFVIQNKSSKSIPFIMNKAQHHIFQRLTGRDIVVKARQMGFSTLFQALHYESVIRRQGVNIVSIADQATNTAHLVSIFDRFHDNIPITERPYRRGRYPYGIKFPTQNAMVHLGTAGNRTWGRSKTVQRIHASEIAFWPDPKTTMEGLLESVPPPEMGPTSVILESTTNGAGGYFYEEVMKAKRGETEWKVHFYPWWWAEEYRKPLAGSIDYTPDELQLIERVLKEEGIRLTKEQINWRRSKLLDLGVTFFQEYPESLETAFLLSGRPRFDSIKLQERLNTQIQKPIYEDYPVVHHGNIYYQLRIYEKFNKLHTYGLGADVAEGIQLAGDSETDFSAAVVRDFNTNRQVATIHGRLDPFEFAFLLHEVGRYFGNAIIGVERNNHGHAVLGYLANGTSDQSMTPYQNLYVFEDGRLGWPTTSKTRPIMVEDLALEYRNPEAYTILDREIIGEALSFVVNAKGKAEATPGAFDDLVIADAICGQMRVRPINVQDVRDGYAGRVKIGDF